MTGHGGDADPAVESSDSRRSRGTGIAALPPTVPALYLPSPKSSHQLTHPVACQLMVHEVDTCGEAQWRLHGTGAVIDVLARTGASPRAVEGGSSAVSFTRHWT